MSELDDFQTIFINSATRWSPERFSLNDVEYILKAAHDAIVEQLVADSGDLHHLTDEIKQLTATLQAANEDAERLAENYSYYHDVAGCAVCVHCDAQRLDAVYAIVHAADCPITLHRARVGGV